MDSYEIIMTPDAVTDLTELRDYIADILLVPEIALRYVRSIRETIKKPEYMATCVAPLPDEPWHSRGIRKINAQKVPLRFIETAFFKAFIQP